MFHQKTYLCPGSSEYWSLRREAFILLQALDDLTKNAKGIAKSTVGPQPVYEKLEALYQIVETHPFAIETLTAHGKSIAKVVADIPAVATPTVFRLMMVGLNRLIQHVPDLPACELLTEAREAGSKGSFEHGWDNYSTAAGLWQSEMRYQVAAVLRHGSTDHEAVRTACRWQRAIQNELERIVCHGEVEMGPCDDDVGESTRYEHWDLRETVGTLALDDILAIIDELAACGRLGVTEWREGEIWDEADEGPYRTWGEWSVFVPTDPNVLKDEYYALFASLSRTQAA